MKLIPIIACAMAIGLTGCGGVQIAEALLGGNGDSSGGPPWPITDKNRAANLIGAQPLHGTVGALGLNRITPNVTVTSDFLAFANDGRFIRINASCRGNSCYYRLGEQRSSFSMDSLSPHELDGEARLVMRANRIDFIQVLSQTDVDTLVTGYGGWLDDSMFVVSEGRSPQVNLKISVSSGWSPGTNPMVGSATWYGSMVGIGTDSSRDIYQGNAGVRVDFSEADVDVAFVGIRNLNTGVRQNDMRWSDLPSYAGAFQGLGIEGRFYGSDHREVGGVFERNQIVGSFGAMRY